MATLIRYLRAAEINFLAVDFDLTLIDTHTEGRWAGSAAELADRARPSLTHLLHGALEAGLHVAVVTLSSQV